MSISNDATYRHVQGLSRGLSILRALSCAENGNATTREISERTRLNRTTVKRILETLVTDGYVRYSEMHSCYSLASDVLHLSEGYTEEALLCQAASPVIRELFRKTQWSLTITTPSSATMLVRDSTHPASIISFEPSVVLRGRIPMLLTAAGRAFFAFSSQDGRSNILALIRSTSPEQASLAHDERLVGRLVESIRRDGFAINDGDWPKERRTAGIAIAVKNTNGNPVGCVSMVYMRPAANRDRVLNEYVPALMDSVSQIEAEMRKLGRASTPNAIEVLSENLCAKAKHAVSS